ncbi:MAG: putative Rossmann fold flavoprotein [Lysobacterales bacterium]|jgi:predicted Rossmann fold flavoprotein
MDESLKKVFVIGGGAAGMMAAISAATHGSEVTLFERNDILGKKVLLTGKGKCNITNACSKEDFFVRFAKNGQFLRDALKAFSSKDVLTFFKEQGIECQVGRQQRVFPLTHEAPDVVDALTNVLRQKKVCIKYHSRIKDLIIRDNKVYGIKFEDDVELPCDSIILATGGASFSGTGSSGDGIDIAENLNHRKVSLRPSLVPLITKEKFPAQLRGFFLKNVRLTFKHGKKKKVTPIGEMMFMLNGISGALSLEVSGEVVDWLAKGEKVHVRIDLKVGMTVEEVNARLTRDLKATPKKNISFAVANFLPKIFIDTFLKLVNIEPLRLCETIKLKEINRLTESFKALTLEVVGSRPLNSGMVTQGGVSLKDVNPKTMESRVVSSLYFTGEMMDIDADTGGFNLQAAFSTGYLAGLSASQ